MNDRMPKKTYTSLPLGYAVCEHAECPLADTCLHQLAYGELIKTETYLLLINPSRVAVDTDGKAQGEGCEFYRNNTLVTYARGFTNFQKRMYPDQYRKFMAICIGHWSRNPYFERRRGDRPLPPSEQAFILDALKRAGVTEEMKFDSYEKNINWYD